jgi:hypothetical protein
LKVKAIKRERAGREAGAVVQERSIAGEAGCKGNAS